MTVYINGVAQDGGAEVGGLYGINVETLTGNKTLTPGVDKIYQYLDEGNAIRIITLANGVAGDRFVIRHNGVFSDTRYLEIKQGGGSLDYIRPGAIKQFIFNGTLWVSGEVGSGELDSKRENVTMGYRANARNGGVSIGYLTDGGEFGVAIGWAANGNDGVAIGKNSCGFSDGVGIGVSSSGSNKGVGIGFSAITNSKVYSIALGYRSSCERVGETSTNINGGDTDWENNVVQGRWEGEVAGGAGATEIFCAGQAGERFLIRGSSVLAFEMIIVARDNVANEVARYSVKDGLIKRDGANNTVMVLCTVVVDHEDDAGWDCAVTADDANEALIITVTGDGVNTTQWAAVMNGVETHF